MSELAPNPNKLYTNPPTSLESLADAYKQRPVDENAARELYDQYNERIDDFPGFKQRRFEDAYDDFASTIISVENQLAPKDLEEIRNRLIKPESYHAFKGAVARHIERYELEDKLAEYSVAFASSHNLFTDVPLEAYTVYDIRQAEPY